MTTKQLVDQLQKEKTVLIAQIAELRESVDELAKKRSEILDDIDSSVPASGDRRKVIIDELLIEAEDDDLAIAFDDYFAKDDPFVHSIRKALYED